MAIEGIDKNKVTDENGLMHAVGYIRVSTKQQAQDDRCGLEVQREAIEQYAADHGYIIVKWYEDQMSGAKDHRPAFDQILYGSFDSGDDVKFPPISAVISFKADRISRDTKMYFYYMYILERKGVKLISTQENFDEMGDEHGLNSVYRSLILFVAEQERKNIALRTGKGRYMKARAGGHACGRAAYGYTIEDKKLVIVPEEAEIVRLIYNLRFTKFMSYAEIITYLIDHGIRTRKGTIFGNGQIQNILGNSDLYHGWYKMGEMEERVPGQHEPILFDPDTCGYDGQDLENWSIET